MAMGLVENNRAMDFSLRAEQQAFLDYVKQFARERIAPRAFTSEFGDYPWRILEAFGEAGISGLDLPVEDGGRGRSLLDTVLATEVLARTDGAAGDAMQATNFGAIRQFSSFAPPALKARVLPALLAGKALITVGMSEADAGSSLTELTTTATLDGDQVVLNGHKLWNTNGPYATSHVVWARFPHVGPGAEAIGLLYVPTDAPGYRRGPLERYVSGEAYCAVYFEDCRLPREYVLLERDGLRRMFGIFNVERLGNGARSLGLGQAALDRTIAYLKERRQFGRSLMEFQALQFAVVDMHVKLEGARNVLYRAAWQATRGEADPATVGLAKVACNEAALAVAQQAALLLGARGVSEAEPVSRIMRRVQALCTSGGTLEVQKLRIAESLFETRFDQRPPRPPKAS